MKKKDNIEIFIDEVFSKLTRGNYPTNKIRYNHIDEIWSTDLADMVDDKFSNNKEFRYLFIIIDNFIKYLWCIPLENKNNQTITIDFWSILTTPIRKPLKLKSDRGADFYNNIFQIFLKVKILQCFSRYTDKDPSIAERVNKTMCN